MITLINVIEINPLLYTKDDFELPESSDYPDPEEWRFKWKRQLPNSILILKLLEKDLPWQTLKQWMTKIYT